MSQYDVGLDATAQYKRSVVVPREALAGRPGETDFDRARSAARSLTELPAVRLGGDWLLHDVVFKPGNTEFARDLGAGGLRVALVARVTMTTTRKVTAPDPKAARGTTFDDPAWPREVGDWSLSSVEDLVVTDVFRADAAV